MSSALASLPLRISFPQRLLLASAFAYTAVFGLVVAYGRPGLGVSQGFYLAIVLAALATGAPGGAAAGAAALVLYDGAELLAGRITWDMLFQPTTGIRLVSYVVAGATVGWFATKARRMLADSFGVLDELLVLARRDPATGLRSPAGFEDEISGRIARGNPFAVLVTAVPTASRGRTVRTDGAPSRQLAAALGREGDVAALGPSRLAAIVDESTAERAQARGDRVERELAAAGTDTSVGWAFHPADGVDVLTLVSTAVERLHERRFVRGELRPTAASAGLVAPLNRA